MSQARRAAARRRRLAKALAGRSQAQRLPPQKLLAAELGVSTKTLQRDLRALRGARVVAFGTTQKRQPRRPPVVPTYIRTVFESLLNLIDAQTRSIDRLERSFVAQRARVERLEAERSTVDVHEEVL